MSKPHSKEVPVFGKKNPLGFWNIVLIVSLAFGLLFICYPFLYLFKNSFSNGEGGLTLAHYAKFFSKNYYKVCLTNTLKLALASTLTATAIGLPLAYINTRFNVMAKGFTNTLVIISLMSPPFIGAYAWVLLLGNNGYITSFFAERGIEIPTIYGFWGMLLVFTLKLYPYIFLYAQGALQKIDSTLEEASESLGVHGLKRIFKITLPVIIPTLLNAMLMVFMTSVADYGTPQMIGKNYKVLTVAIYEEFMTEMTGDTAFASALAVMVTVCMLIILIIQKTSIASKSYVMSALRPPQERKLHGFKRLLASLPIMIVGLVGTLPILVIVYTSFRKVNGTRFAEGFGLDSYINVLGSMGRYIRNTFVLSVIAIIIVILVGLLGSYLIVRKNNFFTGMLDVMCMFPYVIPGSVIGISLVVAFNKKPIILTGTFLIMVVSYVIRKLPFTLRSSVGILYSIEPSIEEASVSLGVPPMKTFFKTTAPLMLPGLFSGALLSFIEIINELSSSMILYTGKTTTISVAIFSALFRDAYGTAAALATILIAVTVICLIIFNKVSGGKSYVG